MDGAGLRPGREFLDRARMILRAERGRLAGLLAGVAHELDLVGGSSLPDTLTKGDVDLHLRVPPAGFAATVQILRGVYRVVHPEIWQVSLATFGVAGTVLPTGVAVTPVGSVHDRRFRAGWQRLAADPALVRAYNAMKVGGPGEYERAKSAFFDMLADG